MLKQKFRQNVGFKVKRTLKHDNEIMEKENNISRLKKSLKGVKQSATNLFVDNDMETSLKDMKHYQDIKEAELNELGAQLQQL